MEDEEKHPADEIKGNVWAVHVWLTAEPAEFSWALLLWLQRGFGELGGVREAHTRWSIWYSSCCGSQHSSLLYKVQVCELGAFRLSWNQLFTRAYKVLTGAGDPVYKKKPTGWLGVKGQGDFTLLNLLVNISILERHHLSLSGRGEVSSSVHVAWRASQQRNSLY